MKTIMLVVLFILLLLASVATAQYVQQSATLKVSCDAGGNIKIETVPK